MSKHWAIFIDNSSAKKQFIDRALKGDLPDEFSFFRNRKGLLFSKASLNYFLDEEDKHGVNHLDTVNKQALKTRSSGEQKKALLQYQLKLEHDFIILDNPYDNLDLESQNRLKSDLEKQSEQNTFIQLISRKSDLLSFINNFAYLNGEQLLFYTSLNEIPKRKEAIFSDKLPSPLKDTLYDHESLVSMNNVGVSFQNKTVVQNINWEIKPGEFWQLIGNNGSGKTTLLSMITGENPKGYGQNLVLFGIKKGSGESIWDIKKNIGYFSPAMTYKFKGRHSLLHMLVSGLNDSIGLYVKPTESQLNLAIEWLELLEMKAIKDVFFYELSEAYQRLIMIARAMIKHPLLLILDEPTEGLDDQSAKLIVNLVNKIGKESNTATIFVSHRVEPGLQPDHIFELKMTPNGSVGISYY